MYSWRKTWWILLDNFSGSYFLACTLKDRISLQLHNCKLVKFNISTRFIWVLLLTKNSQIFAIRIYYSVHLNCKLLWNLFHPLSKWIYYNEKWNLECVTTLYTDLPNQELVWWPEVSSDICLAGLAKPTYASTWWTHKSPGHRDHRCSCWCYQWLWWWPSSCQPWLQVDISGKCAPRTMLYSLLSSLFKKGWDVSIIFPTATMAPELRPMLCLELTFLQVRYSCCASYNSL